ncbi:MULTISPECIES: ATP-dependent Clp protease proteolytic subunit [Candidatus Accumulibacter]|uniref:ATP-dependent Clp protease proteolytic subunit n=2 Tax=Candidatus Accumulibacter TaxID=327159 RepID=A0A080M581_9PROT|nr:MULTISPECIES: ATP-dependent Clp protease proteolytic subunit [Candidatus Accumulibacter]KFB76378.1 MAG: ATP-dependent Clp protease proteolytic subunit [Candidatus Accumulibacter cognatus]TMQ78660.1 hypothetical protein ACCUM_0957 [Candidatus Accumulibacter phosphatis]
MSGVTMHCEADHARITFRAPVDAESIYALCDAIDLALSYFHYETVEIRIHSPGGESDALRHLVVQLPRWHRRGVLIRTVAMIECASAAAIILAVGSPGHRHAGLSSRLLFHRPRIDAGAVLSREVRKIAGVLTAESGAAVIRQLERLEKSICREDDHHHGIVRTHIRSDQSGSQRWFATERQRRASLLAAPRDRLVAGANRGIVPIEDQDLARLSDAAAALADPALSDPQALEVLFVVLGDILDADRPINPLLAWALFLVDHVDGLDLGEEMSRGAP